MALVVKQNKKLEHPTEPGQWFVVRLPLSAGDMAGMRSDGKQIGMTLDLMAAGIQEWSYPVPVSEEAVNDLDLDTFVWLSKEITSASGIRDDDEKKDLSSPSPPTTAPVTEISQPSLAT